MKPDSLSKLSLIIGGLLIFFYQISLAQDSNFVAPNFNFPEKLETEDFRIKKLSLIDADKEYEAIMRSIDHIRRTSPPGSEWPNDNMTREEHKLEIEWHLKEFKEKRSFAYSIVTPDESRVLGGIYIYPSKNKAYDASIIIWVRIEAYKNGMDPMIFRTVKNWVTKEWPFKNPAYPGRLISWEDFQQEN
jgi:hypothetical protein